ncbi:DUF4169 family protein [Thalassospira mesophila]|uniref:DUF4169 family protein n=1 Tax=Thalassospira mesophila TaxID=1293891 RepID=UPI000A1D6039|nr:DUF4169 family protein [Thalassospira mesophila]
MADVVNLRQHRKRKARDEKSRKAEANRASFGRTRTERDETRALKDLATKKIDGHLRQNDADPEDEPAAGPVPCRSDGSSVDGRKPDDAASGDEGIGQGPRKALNTAVGDDGLQNCATPPVIPQRSTMPAKTPLTGRPAGPGTENGNAPGEPAKVIAQTSRVIRIDAWRGQKQPPKNS